MRNWRPRWRTEVNIRTTATGTQRTDPTMRHHSGGGFSGRRQKKAMKIARHSSNRPTRVGPIAVMEARFWLWGAIKKNGYAAGRDDAQNNPSTSASRAGA